MKCQHCGKELNENAKFCDGNYTYETVLGNNISLPKIDIKYYELNN